MEIFMECICENNLRALIVTGDPAPVQLGEAWMKLFYEYCDLVDQPEVKYRAKLYAEIELLDRKIQYADTWAKILQFYFTPVFVSGLKYLGFDYELNPDDPAQYKNDLARIVAELRALKLKLKVKKQEYEFIEKNRSTTEEVISKKYFHEIFDKINDLKNREAITEKSTVMQYAIALSRLADAAESIKLKALRNGRRI